MVDEHPPDDRSSPSSDESSIDAASEDDLDALLAEASALASEVSAELGEPLDLHDEALDLDNSSGVTDATPSACGDPESEVEEDPSEELDSKLAAIDTLIDDTRREVGTEEDEQAEDDGAPEASPPFVPDFMDEFTRPPEEVPASPEADEPAPSEPVAAPQDKAPPVEHATGVEERPRKPAEAKVPERPPPTKADENLADAAPGASFEDEFLGMDPEAASAASKPVNELVRAAPRRRRRSWSLGEPLVTCGLAGVRLLEVMDRPFARLGDPARTAIGWLAVATFLTSLIVLLISLA